MAIPEKVVAAATEVLVYHHYAITKQGNGCSCGWAELGRSIAEHQAKLVIAAVFEAQARMADE